MDSFLNEDLTTIESISPFLKQCVGKGKEIPTGNILQVQQVTNVSFPTYDKPTYDSDRHTLKLTVTDGQSQGYALVPDSCPGLSTNTAPGTKLRTTQPIPVQGSLFLLNRNNCEVIGGRVAKLYEKWEIQKKMAIKHDWGYTGSAVEGEGPPPWKPFGYRPSIDDVSLLRKMKTTDVANKKDGQTGGTAKSQFDMQRDEAISELHATANKQKFQKPNKHLLDKEITDIMEEGFSQSDAEYAMNRFKNTQKALKFLKDSKKHQEGLPREPPKPVFERKDRRKKGKGNDEDEEQEVPVEYQRPTKSISLFGFIEGQIKADEKPAVQTPNGPPSHNYGRRSQDLEDGMGRLNFKDSRNDSYYGRGERGRGRGGYRGGSDGYRGGNDGHRGGGNGYRGGGDSYRGGGGDGYRGRGGYRGGGGYNGPRDRDNDRDLNRDNDRDRNRDNDRDRDVRDREPYQPQQQRYDNKGIKPDPTQRPPRFQNRGGGNDSRPSDYNPPPTSRNQSTGGNYDSYRGSNRDNYDSRCYPPPSSNSSSRQDYSLGYQSQQQQQRPSTGNERSYGSDYHQQQPQYQKSNDYPVPSQTYQQSSSYSQQQQQQHSQGPRQYSNNNSNSQSHENMGYPKSSGQQRAPPSQQYSNHSSGGHPDPPSYPEFTHYQYGYEGWNPTQSLVFTRSKGDSGRGSSGRGGGGFSTSGRGASSQSNSYNNSRGNSRY